MAAGKYITLSALQETNHTIRHSSHSNPLGAHSNLLYIQRCAPHSPVLLICGSWGS